MAEGHRFHGARKLGSTGLLYLRNRVYDPSLGRFLSRDPISFDGGPNLYSYASFAPSVGRDPEGLYIERRPGTNTDRLLSVIELTTNGRDLISQINSLSGADIVIKVRASSNNAIWDKRNPEGPLRQFGSEEEKNAYLYERGLARTDCPPELGNTPRFPAPNETPETYYSRVFEGSHVLLHKANALIDQLNIEQSTQFRATLAEMSGKNRDGALAISLYHELLHIYQILSHIKAGKTLPPAEVLENEAYRRTIEEYLPYRRRLGR